MKCVTASIGYRLFSNVTRRDDEGAGFNELKAFVDLCAKVMRCREEMDTLPREACDAVEFFAMHESFLSAAIADLSSADENSLAGGQRLNMQYQMQRMCDLKAGFQRTYAGLGNLWDVPPLPEDFTPPENHGGAADNFDGGVETGMEDIPDDISDLELEDIDGEYSDTSIDSDSGLSGIARSMAAEEEWDI